MVKQKEKKSYPIFAQRLSKENIEWLNKEKNNFDSWNKFFNSIRESYKKH